MIEWKERGKKSQKWEEWDSNTWQWVNKRGQRWLIKRKMTSNLSVLCLRWTCPYEENKAKCLLNHLVILIPCDTFFFAYSKIIFIVLRVRAHHFPNISPCSPFIGKRLTQSVHGLSSRHICPHPSFSSMFNHKYPLPGFSTGLNQNIWILISWPLEDKQKIKIVLNSLSLH